MSRGSYAGQPYSFYCAKCRNVYDPTSHYRRGERWRTTGKTREQFSKGMNYHHWPNIAFQYECLDCGHVGWSRHPIVERRFKKEHGDKA